MVILTSKSKKWFLERSIASSSKKQKIQDKSSDISHVEKKSFPEMQSQPCRGWDWINKWKVIVFTAFSRFEHVLVYSEIDKYVEIHETSKGLRIERVLSKRIFL